MFGNHGSTLNVLLSNQLQFILILVFMVKFCRYCDIQISNCKCESKYPTINKITNERSFHKSMINVTLYSIVASNVSYHKDMKYTGKMF